MLSARTAESDVVKGLQAAVVFVKCWSHCQNLSVVDCAVGAGVNLDTMKFNMILVMHPGVAEETFVISLGVSEKASDATQRTA